MLFKNKIRAVYSRAVYGNVIAIIDQNEGRSVTNDAANIIDDLARQGFDLAKCRVIYKDTSGIWDEILVDRTGRFAGFSSSTRTCRQAVTALSLCLATNERGGHP